MIDFLCKNILSACLIKLNEVSYLFDGGYRSMLLEQGIGELRNWGIEGFGMI